MLRIYHTKPYPVAYHEEDIQRIAVGAFFERHIETIVDVDGLRAAQSTEEMAGCFRYRHALVANLYAEADLNRGVLSSGSDGDEDDSNPVQQVDLGNQEHVLMEVEGALLTTEFLKGHLKLKSKRTDKIQQYCDRIAHYVARIEKASIAMLETKAQEEGLETPSAAVLASANEAEANTAALLQKIDDTVDKIAKLVNRSDDVAPEADKEEGIKAFTDEEMLVVEDQLPKLSLDFLKSIMGAE